MLFPNSVKAPAFVRMNAKEGVVVGLETDVVNSGDRFPAENDVTVPPEPEIA